MSLPAPADHAETASPTLPRVLLLGWEYAPRLTGGLGTASVRLAHELARHVELSVIVPRLPEVAAGAEEAETLEPPLSALATTTDDGPDALRHFPPSAEWPEEPLADRPDRRSNQSAFRPAPVAPVGGRAADPVAAPERLPHFSQALPARLTALSHLTPAAVRAATVPPRPPKYEVFARQVQYVGVDLPSPYADVPEATVRESVRLEIVETVSEVVKSESHLEEPESYLEEPESHLEEPKSHLEEPESYLEEPESHLEEPESHLEEPESYLEEPESHADEMEAPEEARLVEAPLPDPLAEALAPFQRPAINPLTLPSSNTEVVQFARLAARVASADEVDVIYAHDWPTFLAGVEIRLAKRVPLVLHVHSTSYDRHGPQSHGWVYELERAAFRAADRIVAVSQYGAEVLQQHYGVDAARLRVVHHGLAAGPLGPQWEARPVGDAPQVLFVGRLTGQKNPLGFVDIARLVADELPNVRFVVAGDGPLRDQVRRAADEAELEEPQFELLGFLNDVDVTAALLASAVVCLPARSEPFGLVALEAAAAGVPLVLSTTTGAAEVLPGVLTADWNDAAAMADHVLALLRDEPARRRAVRENAAAARRLTWERAAYEVMEVFKEVMA
jgi:glycogen synthase